MNGPLPALSEGDLGNTLPFEVEVALIPYLLGVLHELSWPGNFYGTQSDIDTTHAALMALMAQFANLGPLE